MLISRALARSSKAILVRWCAHTHTHTRAPPTCESHDDESLCLLESLKKQIQDLEMSLRKAESEKQSKDHQIRSLQDEMSQQDENIARLNKVEPS